MTLDPHAALILTLASVAAWLMMQAGLAKNALEFRRKRHVCPSCGRQDDCSCGA
jgi:formate dehydrogenase maturation protein FdhE